MSHEVLVTRRQSIFNFFANPGRGRPQKAGASWCWLVGMPRLASAWICKKSKNALSFWLSGPHGTCNFDHQSLIHSNLCYTNTYEVSTFCGDQVDFDSTENICNSAEVPYLWGCFSCFHGQNKYKIEFSAHCSTLKKLISMKVRKRKIG